MKLLHTADWHLGKRLKGIDRTAEIEYALALLLEQAKDLEVDAVLVAGNIFDTPTPTAEAEKVFYHFFCQLKELRIPSVLIAGNHDSAERVQGIAHLLSYVGVKALGRPKKAEQGGIITLDTAHGQLCVAAVPFASERRLLRMEELWAKEELAQRQHYKEVIAHLMAQLARHFQEENVNIVLAHLTIENAVRTYSEVAYYTRDAYELAGQLLPAQAQYIALGHIHKSQQVPHSAPTYYAGSLIQIDFGEAGEEKGFNLITVEPGRPAKVEFKPIPCQKPLLTVECEQATLVETLERFRDHPGFLKVIVELHDHRLGLAEEVRKICPQTLSVEARYPEHIEKKRPSSEATHVFDAVSEFRHYWQEQVKTPLSPLLLQAFEELYKEFSE